MTENLNNNWRYAGQSDLYSFLHHLCLFFRRELGEIYADKLSGIELHKSNLFLLNLWRKDILGGRFAVSARNHSSWWIESILQASILMQKRGKRFSHAVRTEPGFISGDMCEQYSPEIWGMTNSVTAPRCDKKKYDTLKRVSIIIDYQRGIQKMLGNWNWDHQKPMLWPEKKGTNRQDLAYHRFRASRRGRWKRTTGPSSSLHSLSTRKEAKQSGNQTAYGDSITLSP